ncbi:hypothetical protein F4806DRAFT_499933 [Annulohypoxylon nitens]|nr:hypothetical protein F4806DRAFT_499933 [Annulohypoxylon nitens]
MLPPHLEAVYNRAKDDTNAFLAWLDTTSHTCGYVSPRSRIASLSTQSQRTQPRLSTNRLESTQRGVSRHGTSIRQLRARLDAIINFSTTYASIDHSKDEFNDAGHRFFVSFLQETLSKFQERESNTLAPHGPTTKNAVPFHNRFSQLRLEEEDEN